MRGASADAAARLRAERDLAAEYGVAYDTIRRATALLREPGLSQTVHGRGTFVVKVPQDGEMTIPGHRPGRRRSGRPARCLLIPEAQTHTGGISPRAPLGPFRAAG
ncbi:MAG: GntR family transcriptional regulator [Streptosporangiaceae bacterium]